MSRRLGSTEIAAVAALYVPSLAAELPKTKTATDVWCRLRWGLDAPSNGRMARGLRVEPWGRTYYEKHIGPYWRPVPFEEKWVVPHPSREWASASPDGYDAPTPRVVIEMKTQADPWARGQWGTPGTDEMATRYLYQAQWLLSCADAEECVVLCLFGQDTEDESGEPNFVITEPAVYRVERDAEVEAALLAYGERFIEEFVRPGIPPPVKPHANRRVMKARLADERGSDAVRRWQAECLEYAATQLGAQAVRGDGAGGPGAEERP